MRNVLQVFGRDLKRLLKAPAAWSVALFLIVLPSLYTWFNVAAFWNPYDNTGNLRVCVVNEDRGVNNDLLGRLNLGNQIVGQLEQNSQLGWAFLSYDEAMEEVESGSAYAAFVIPADFSKGIADLLDGNLHQTALEYYVNEKVGPVSPKVTDTGATSLDTTINDAFFSTVSSTVVSALNDKLDETWETLGQGKATAAAKVDQAISGIRQARTKLDALADALASIRAKAADAQISLDTASEKIDSVSAALSRTSALIGQVNTGMVQLSNEVMASLDETSAEVSRAVSEARIAFADASAAIQEARRIADGLPDEDGSLAPLKRLLDDTAASMADIAGSLDGLAQDAIDDSHAYRNTIATETVPAISSGLTQLAAISSSLSATVSSQKLLISQASLILGELDSTLGLTADSLATTASMLDTVTDDLEALQTDLAALGSSGALAEMADKGGIDAGKVADFMESPTRIVNEELYPINAYGSAMAPLFMNLTLWIGVFMLMVIIRLEVDDEGIPNLTIAQRFLGRGIFLAIMAAAQAAVCCTGCLILGVQTVNAPALFLTAIVASLTYLAIQYSLSTALQHVGKAFCVILVFVQIPGATGLYPIEMTPDFFHTAYPVFPFTYGINAMREAICGFYDGQWLYNLGILGVFFVIFTLFGVLVRPYLTNLNRMFARQIEQSDIIVGESVQLPARRYRMSQIISAFTDREEYRAELNARLIRFMGLYPKLKRATILVGILAPLIVTTVQTLLGVEKVIMLTTWLIWLVLIVALLVILEYLSDYFSHLVSLDSMTADEVRAAYSGRNRFTRVRSVPDYFGQKPIVSATPAGNGQGRPANFFDPAYSILPLNKPDDMPDNRSDGQKRTTGSTADISNATGSTVGSATAPGDDTRNGGGAR